ncbi:hypothetical protein ACB092_03G235900 [Castanea dentata]
MKKSTTIFDFFKRKASNSLEANTSDATLPTTNVEENTDAPIEENLDIPIEENPDEPVEENLDVPFEENSQTKFQKVDMSSLQLERDPGLRRQIYTYHVDQRDEIRRRYITLGPYQPRFKKFLKSKKGRSFQGSWYEDDRFKPWLEYSPKKDAAFCLLCFLFHKPTGHDGQNAFTVNGFKNWKKVRNGESCSFSLHMGKDLNSTHRFAHKACQDLMNQSQHIDRVVGNFTSEQIVNNRVRLKASIDVVRHLALQAIAFRGRDESSTSTNRGNFLTTLDLMVSYNNNVVEIMAKAPKNATYTSPQIQKEILHVISTRVKKAIREEIGDAKFCILVDEARDESMKEQMAVVLRFVDTTGFVRERFYGIVHVVDTAAVTLKKEIYYLLSNQCLDIQNIRGQGYDGASNMRDLETGKGLNQMVTLQRPGDTRWGSHYKSVSNLIKLFSPTCEVLLKIMDEGNSSQKVEAESAYEVLISFEFIFILHFVNETMGITDKLCQALQNQSQDILNAMHLVSSTKKLIQQFRDEKWDDLLATVISFCKKRGIDVPDMNARYVARFGRSRHQQEDFKNEHYYKVDIFNAGIDSQLQELNHRFSDHAMELLTLSSALDPREAYESFRVSDICSLVDKFYPIDFTDDEKNDLKKELDLYKYDVVQHSGFKNLKNISELCQWMVRTRKSEIYPLICRVVKLVLTLPVSTATTERAFSAMNVIKTDLRNKMEDEFLLDAMMLFIERDIAATISTDSIIDDFEDLKRRRVPFS